MHSIADHPLGFSAADAAELTDILTEVQSADSIRAAAEVARVRALARAGELAARQAEGQIARVRAHDMALRGIAAELAGASRTTDRAMQRQIDEARTLVEEYPVTLRAWERAEITRAHVRVITDAGTPLPFDVRPAFDERAAALAAQDTPNRVKAQVELLAARMHPRTLTERHDHAKQSRDVRVVPLGDNMAELCVKMAALTAHAIFDRSTQMARTIIDAREHHPDEVIASDTRTMGQLRSDVIAEMLLTASPLTDPTIEGDGPGVLGAIRAKVQVVVPALALTGSDTAPASLVGQGPIDGDTARRLAAGTAWWERLVTHPVTGMVLHADGYARPASLDRWLRARDQHCRFPGCTLPAVRCEVDHTHDYALGGRTEARNLAHLCQRHHSMKQFTAWSVRQLEGGILEWTSPTGRVQIESPPPVPVHFVPDADPPPAVDPSLALDPPWALSSS